MSKSLGNTIAPSDVEKQFGAEILRLWVTSVDSSNDVRISMDILSQVSETYRKIRNTLRFLIANTSDFNPTQDAVAYDELRSVDKYMTIRFNQLVKTIRDAYANFEFLTIYKACLLYTSDVYKRQRHVLAGNMKKVASTMYLLTPVDVVVNIEDIKIPDESQNGEFGFDMKRTRVR